MPKKEYDEIGDWSEMKLEIVRKYAVAYSTIMAKQPRLSHVYIDAFAGRGVHISRSTGEFVAGSPLNALNVKPPFKEFFLIDLDSRKAGQLRNIVKGNPSVHLHAGDCNKFLLSNVFPKVTYKEYKRGLCLLDPYGLHLDWKVMETAGRSRVIEIFLNFPIADMNRNVLWLEPDKANPAQRKRMNAFWGDDSWRSAAYTTEQDLFQHEEKLGNDAVVAAFQRRLSDVAGFKYVAEPLPMRNTIGAVVYYLFFASPSKTGASIVKEIFDTYRRRGTPS